jgi:hypothetical protein
MIQTWLRKQSKRSRPARTPRRRPALPRLELLEDRAVPATITWTGDAGTLNWDAHRNWNLDRVPVAGDNAVVPSAFTGITITHIQSNTDACDSIDSYANIKVNAGSLSVASASTFRGDLTVSAVTSTTLGTLTLAQNSTVAGGFNMLGGTLGGAGNLTVSGLVTWTGGTMQDAGHTVASGGMTLGTGGTGTKTLSGRTVDNNGTATWTGGDVNANNGSVWNNALGSTLDAQANNLFTFTAGAAPQFNNAGTVQKSAGTGTSRFDGTFTNTGTLNPQTGTINLNSPFSNSATVTIASGATLTVAGTYTQTAGTTAVNGTLSPTGNVLLQGGVLQGSGTINAPVVNSSHTGPGNSPGLLTINGDYTQTADGALDIELGGSEPGSSYDQLAVTGTATLDGTLNITYVNGFDPTLNQEFQILTSGALSGQFARVTGTQTPSGRTIAVDYSAGGVTLMVSRTTTAEGTTLTLNEGQSFSGTVATFTSSDPNADASQFSASIDWGDGTTDTGSVSADPNGGFDVSGAHSYTEEGSYALAVAITDSLTSQTVTANGSANVADAQLGAQGRDFGGQEAASTGTVTTATFRDRGGSEDVSDYSALIDWGDGSSSAGTIVYNAAGDFFSVKGDHIYSDSGSYTVDTTITHENGVSIDAFSTATIDNLNPSVALSGPGDGVTGQGRTFTFTATDPSPTDQNSAFTFAIDWGDGTQMVTANSPAMVSHRYYSTGTFTVSVTATDKDGGTSDAASTSITIADIEMQGNNLVIGGTAGNDSYVFTPGNAGAFSVTRNGTPLGSFNPPGSIVVAGGDGVDSITLNGTSGSENFTIDQDSIARGSRTIQGESVEGYLVNGNAGNDRFTFLPGGAAVVDGGSGTDTVVGPAQSNVWSLTGPGAGVLNGSSTFQNIENVVGGSADDLFQVGSAASLAGTLSGGGASAGLDTLDYSNYGSPVTINLATRTAPGLSFANITGLLGTSGMDTLIGPNAGNIWLITANDAGRIGKYNFQSFENLTGGTVKDTFKLSDQVVVSGQITGVGFAVLNYAQYTTGVTVNLVTGTATNVLGGISGVENVVGSLADDSLTGDSQNNFLIGKDGNDTITGGGGNDVLEGSAGDDLLIAGSQRSILIGGGGSDTLMGGSDDDILIAGYTNYDGPTNALRAIMSEWVRTDEDYNTRVFNIRNGLGNTQGFAFNSTTIHLDGSLHSNSLTGGPGMDWFWANLRHDTINDAEPGEQIN